MLKVERADAFHEAGHAVIGVLQGFVLEAVTGINAPGLFPHTTWASWGISEEEAKDAEKKDEHTRRFALMCLAAEFSEGLVNDVSNPESAEAIHCDYLDAEVSRKNAGFQYFGLRVRDRLRREVQELVENHRNAVVLVAEELATGKTLAQEQVVELINRSR